MRKQYIPELDFSTTEAKGDALVRAISADIERGHLLAGDRLPGSRTLAERCGMHRSTVVRAIEELVAEGWLVTQQGKGTFVANAFPTKRSSEGRARGMAVRSGFAVPAVSDPWGFDRARRRQMTTASAAGRNLLRMTGGLPDLRLVPTAPLSRAIRTTLARHGRQVLDYQDPRGDAQLRQVIAAWVGNDRDVVAQADNVMVVRGAQMALSLIAMVLLKPQDKVAVEAYGYPPAWRALGRTGATLVPIGVDNEGLRVEDLDAAGPFRAIYLTPHHQHPTGATLSASRRRALLAYAKKHRVALIEDDYDHEVHFDGRPVPPLASRDGDGVTIYVGTLSKAFAPGVRTGFVIAPLPLIERLAEVRVDLDRQGDHVTERALADLIESGEIDRHTRRVTRVYRERRDTLCAELHQALGGSLAFERPRGGMALWAKTARGIDPVQWQQRAFDAGLAISVGRDYAFVARGRVPFLRIGFASVEPAEIRRAVQTLLKTRPRAAA